MTWEEYMNKNPRSSAPCTKPEIFFTFSALIVQSVLS